MISENDKKILDLIEKLAKLSLSKLNDSYFIQSTFSDFIRDYEKLEDNSLRHNIKTKCEEILVARDKIKIKKYLNELLFVISKAKEITKTYIDVNPENITKSDRYKKDCKKYSSYLENISDIENKILNSPSYQNKLHEPMRKDNKRWPGPIYCHARLTSNLRLIYLYFPGKKIIFDAILTKNELEKS